jgi:hypothetical protein
MDSVYNGRSSRRAAPGGLDVAQQTGHADGIERNSNRQLSQTIGLARCNNFRSSARANFAAPRFIAGAARKWCCGGAGAAHGLRRSSRA